MNSSTPQRILIVEDDHDIAQIARMILQKEGYEVSLAADGLEGLELVSENPPHLIITDVMMPDMDGLQFIAALKQKEQSAQIPVMMMSALTEDGHAQRGRAAGAEYYLKKPFERAQLVAAVKGVFAVAQKKQKLNERASSEML